MKPKTFISKYGQFLARRYKHFCVLGELELLFVPWSGPLSHLTKIEEIGCLL